MITTTRIVNPPQSDRDALRNEIQTAVRNSIREARINVRNQGQDRAQLPQRPPMAPAAPRAPQEVIDALSAQIAGEKASIQKLSEQLAPGISDARESSITDQISSAQERITSLQSQLDRALGVAVVRTTTRGINDFPFAQSDIPQRVESIVYSSFLFIATLALGIPLIRTIGRRVDRKTQVAMAAASSGNSNVEPRLERIEQAVEAIAIEVERVSEGQRFTNKLMSEMRALPAPNPLEQWPKVQEKEAVRRGE